MKTEYLEKAGLIAADNISSAQQILKDLLDLMMSLVTETGTDYIRDLKDISTSIPKVQSQMSALSNVCKLVLSVSEKLKPDGIYDYLSTLRSKIEEAPARTAGHAFKLIKSGRSYVTLSQSEFVLKTFEKASGENKLATVFVMESRPLFEGRQTARALTKMGHHSILISDSSIGNFLNEIDSAIVGADSILADGTVVNKVGSYPLAVCCSATRKDFYVVTSALKFDPRKKAPDFTNKEENPNEIYAVPEYTNDSPLWPAEVRNLYFDKVSPDFVTAIVTESGRISPSSARKKLNSLMHQIYD